MKSKTLKRVLTAGLSAAVFATMGLGASAITYDVPTSPATVDDSLILCAAHAQADATPEIIGLTNTTDRAGEVPNDYSLEKAQSSVLIGTFGTDINSYPNPYLYNWAYNSWAKENNRTLADKHTLGGISGHPNSVDAEIVEDLGTSRSLYYRPDILVGTSGSTSYEDLVKALPENTDSDTNNDYNPYIVNYAMTSCTDFLKTLYDIANDCEEIMKADSSRKMRYGDPLEIADQLTRYTVGIQSYILKQLSANNAPMKTVAVFDPLNSSDGVFFCVDAGTSTQGTTTRSRVGEFLDQTTVNVVHKLGKQSTTKQINNAEKAFYALSAEEIVSNSDIIITGGVNNGGNKSEDEIREMLLEYIDPGNTDLVNKVRTMPVMSSSFSTVGSIGANSIENLLGMAYWPSFCYPEYINPVYAATYWYYNFYHVTDNNKLATIIDSTMSTASKPDGVTTDISGYSETAFQNLINEGMDYYNANKASINNTILDGMAALLANKGNNPDDNTPDVVRVSDFTDVSTESWFYAAVSNAVSKSLFNGTSKTTFSPDDSMTRGMFATVLYRMEGNPVITSVSPFADVADSSQYYYNGVVWAYRQGIVKGTSETTYTPSADITREQIAVMFYNTAKYDGKNTDLTGQLGNFPDAGNVDDYAAEAMQWAVGHGLINGADGQLLPRENATRAQVAQMFLNYQGIR